MISKNQLCYSIANTVMLAEKPFLYFAQSNPDIASYLRRKVILPFLELIGVDEFLGGWFQSCTVKSSVPYKSHQNTTASERYARADPHCRNCDIKAIVWRRRRDSDPRIGAVTPITLLIRQALSASQPRLRGGRDQSRTGVSPFAKGAPYRLATRPFFCDF